MYRNIQLIIKFDGEVKLKTIRSEINCEIVVRKSKFISNLIPISSKEEAEEKIREISKKYYDARHNCYAYILCDYEKCSDDGEPSKTAGAPMLDILKKKELTNVLVVVTRYFGGILLGTGGLVKAYSEATQNAIELAEIINVIKGVRYQIEITYDNYKNTIYWCKNLNVNLADTKYENNIVLLLESTKEDKEKLLNNIEIISTYNLEQDILIKDSDINKNKKI